MMFHADDFHKISFLISVQSRIAAKGADRAHPT